MHKYSSAIAEKPCCSYGG